MNQKVIGYIYLDEEDIKQIHDDQLAQFGGQAGLRNPAGLASAISQPQVTWGGEELYSDVYLKAAVLAFGIAESQPFVDGNKRTGLVAALTFLKVNGQNILPDENRLYEAMMDIANKSMSKEGFADLFRELVCEYNAKK